jgi:aspartate/methionine/tyrosine aminotransferase
MRKSCLRPGGVNLFQEMKAKCAEAEASGKKLIKLSIGQPVGPALMVARRAAGEAVNSELESMHEYQDNGSPGVPLFAQKFVQYHIKANLATNLSQRDDVDFLPIPGIKPMLGLVAVASGLDRWGLNCDGAALTMTNPGYQSPKDQCRYYGVRVCEPELTPENEFRIAAYSILSHDHKHCTLTDVAVHFRHLSWAEAFSASKAGNFTGWRVGAMVGSPDFIGDIRTVKGNVDSGFNAFAAAGVLSAFQSGKIPVIAQGYKQRIKTLTDTLVARGMKLAIKPGAGFFTLWEAPKVAFGKEIESGKDFNDIMLEKHGIVGVPFGRYIRYAVVSDIDPHLDAIDEAFEEAKVSY